MFSGEVGWRVTGVCVSREVGCRVTSVCVCVFRRDGVESDWCVCFQERLGVPTVVVWVIASPTVPSWKPSKPSRQPTSADEITWHTMLPTGRHAEVMVPLLHWWW